MHHDHRKGRAAGPVVREGVERYELERGDLVATEQQQLPAHGVHQQRRGPDGKVRRLQACNHRWGHEKRGVFLNGR